MQTKRRMFPRTLAQCVEPLTKPVLARHGIAEARIVREWKDIVGAELAGQTLPQSLSFPRDKQNEGTLTVLTGGAYATELQHLQPVILERLATYFGYRAVSRIQIVQGVLPKPEIRKPLKPKPRGVEKMPVIDVADEDLREALQKLAEALHTHSA